MNQSVWTRLDVIARGLSPFALTLMLLMAGAVPLRVPGLSAIVPALALISVYFWSVHRPDLMPAWAVFVIGLLQDLLSGAPLGVGVLVLLLVNRAVVAQHRFFGGGSFVMVWAVFCVVAMVALVLGWVLVCLIVDDVMDPSPALFHYLTTVAIYPCIAWFLAQAQRSFLR